MDFNLRIKIPTGMNEEQTRGILLSLISSLDEVSCRRRKGSFISHFFQERLDRKERRSIRFLFSQLQDQLRKERRSKAQIVSSSSNLESKIPLKFQKIIKTFQNL